MAIGIPYRIIVKWVNIPIAFNIMDLKDQKNI